MAKAKDSGQALLETALSLAFFFLLVTATIDFGHLTYTQLTLQNAVRQAARYALTGQCISNNGTCTKSRYNSILQTLQDTSFGLINSANLNDVTLTCTNEGGGCPNNAGGPGDIITISVNYPYPFVTPFIAAFFPNRALNIKVSSSFANEPFPPGQS